MLLHIRPRIYSHFKYVTLIDVAIEPLGMVLRGDSDLATRRPYPHKYYAVGCRKTGRKAVDGILIESSGVNDELSVRTRWAIEAEVIVTHDVKYKLIDQDFDAASDQILLWYGCRGELGNWSWRLPDNVARRPAMYVEPVMEVIPLHPERRLNTEDTIDALRGLIVHRKQEFEWPTLERDRILRTKLNDRMPGIAEAFHI